MKSPLNYFCALGLTLALFLILGTGLGIVLAERISLAYMPPEAWKNTYLALVGAGALLSAGLTVTWLYRTRDAGWDLRTAESQWNTLFGIAAFAAVALFTVMVVLFRQEGIEGVYYLYMFGATLGVLPAAFWCSSRFFTRSPFDRAVLWNR
jgi:hypothetical protein